MDIKELLSELKNTYVKLSPSSISGVGVFAIRDIPKGCRSMFSSQPGEWLNVPRAEVEALPEHAKQLVYNYCVYDDQYYYVESTAFKKMDLVCFLNHSDEPNIIGINGEEFESCRDIKKGEELVLNYADVVDYPR